MVPNVDSHIILSSTFVKKQRIAFPRQELIAHISGGLPLPYADRYDVTNVYIPKFLFFRIII